MDRAWQAGKNQEENKLLTRSWHFKTVSALRLLQPKCQFTPALARIFFWPTLFLNWVVQSKNQSESKRLGRKLPAAANCAMMGF
jgi:hypothetical protein